MRPNLRCFARIFALLSTISIGIMPLAFGVRTWPWFDYSMFSWNLKIDSIWGYRVYVRRAGSGELVLVPFYPPRVIWMLFESNLQARNFRAAHEILRAQCLGWPKAESEYDKVLVFFARKRAGTEGLRNFETKLVAEWPMQGSR